VDRFDCDVNLPDGLIEVDHSLHTVFGSVFFKKRLMGLKFRDFLAEYIFVEDFFTGEGSPELGGFGKSVDGVNDHLGISSSSCCCTSIGG